MPAAVAGARRTNVTSETDRPSPNTIDERFIAPTPFGDASVCAATLGRRTLRLP